MWNPIRSLLTFYVKHSKRFEKQLWEYYEDERSRAIVVRCAVISLTSLGKFARTAFIRCPLLVMTEN